MTFKALLIEKDDAGYRAGIKTLDDDNLPEGDVTVRVDYSTINYKDGLAITGKSPVVRKFPLVAGIDFAGTVESSSHAAWKPGDRVVLNGWGVGETHSGGLAQRARVRGDWLVALPAGLKISGGRGKQVLRDAAAPYLPAELLARKKLGFGFSLAEQMRARAPLMRERLLGAPMLDSGFFDRTALARLIDEHTAGTFDHSQPLWTLLMVEGFFAMQAQPAAAAAAPGLVA
mgnify:CR=1 FL=1